MPRYKRVSAGKYHAKIHMDIYDKITKVDFFYGSNHAATLIKLHCGEFALRNSPNKYVSHARLVAISSIFKEYELTPSKLPVIPWTEISDEFKTYGCLLGNEENEIHFVLSDKNVKDVFNGNANIDLRDVKAPKNKLKKGGLTDLYFPKKVTGDFVIKTNDYPSGSWMKKCRVLNIHGVEEIDGFLDFEIPNIKFHDLKKVKGVSMKPFKRLKVSPMNIFPQIDKFNTVHNMNEIYNDEVYRRYNRWKWRSMFHKMYNHQVFYGTDQDYVVKFKKDDSYIKNMDCINSLVRLPTIFERTLEIYDKNNNLIFILG